MLCSTLSGSTPWLIVRLPCGSMSMASTSCPDSEKATARLSVVVVFATPPFWLAKAITFAFRLLLRFACPFGSLSLPLPFLREGLGPTSWSALMRPPSRAAASDRRRKAISADSFRRLKRVSCNRWKNPERAGPTREAARVRDREGRGREVDCRDLPRSRGRGPRQADD